MRIFCECGCVNKRHRPSYGTPFAGACYDCHCSGMRASMVELHVGERRILDYVSESTRIRKDAKIGEEELRVQLVDDPAVDALNAILQNLSLAGFVQFVRPAAVAATPAGRQYLQEHPTRG